MTELRRTAVLGRIILLDGRKIATANTPLAANALADALEYAGSKKMPIEAQKNILDLVQ